VLRRLQRSLHEGAAPTREVVDGFLLLLAGALLVPPGFITDVAGLLLLLPPVRVVVRTWLMRSLAKRTSVAVRFVDGFGRRTDFISVVDVESEEELRREPPRGELGP
jgi:UPF0716 protein FxsA